MSWKPLTEKSKPVHCCTFSHGTLADSAGQVCVLQCGGVSERSSHIQWVVSDCNAGVEDVCSWDPQIVSNATGIILVAVYYERTKYQQKAKEAGLARFVMSMHQ